MSRYRTMLERERSGGAAKIGQALVAEGIEVEGRGRRSGDGEIARTEGVFESCRAGGESGVGVEAVEGVVFGLGEGDELEAAGAIEVEELGKHFGVEGTDVHEKDVGDVAVEESVRKLAVINDVGTGGGEVSGFELGDGGGIGFGNAAGVGFIPEIVAEAHGDGGDFVAALG